MDKTPVARCIKFANFVSVLTYSRSHQNTEHKSKLAFFSDNKIVNK